ncbi:MAG TPA: EscU/YscU/HrcU family type III secretion system export apparatus switch protein [Candidatus Binatia bacterium]|nr:EscU/YscU/HrcU family type III secretion system export apparatus switch protein [Candidatus Binatia bacterium]
MADGAADRTERATPKRREEARKHGQVVRSGDLSPIAEILCALLLVSWGGPHLLEQSRTILRDWLQQAGPLAANHEGLGAVAPLVGRTLVQTGTLLVPFFFAMALAGGGAVLAQVGWSPNPALLLPDANRVNPASGFRRLFSADGAMSLLKAALKIGVALALAYRVVRGVSADAVAAPRMGLEQILAFTGYGFRRLFLVLALALAVLGFLDWLWQRWRYEQSLRMSRQEVREEHREQEGDPQVKARFRRAHREIAKRRMLTEVKRADVVLTNPVHVAVALRYRAAENAAPQVVAKGAGELAQKIKEAARAAGVPIVERRALARALFKSVKLGAEIPPNLYRAVAEILAYIYSLRGARAAEAR